MSEKLPFTQWYEPLRELKSKGSQAEKIANMGELHAKRELVEAQYFTPHKIAYLMWKLAESNFDKFDPDYRINIFDNSIGSGRLVQFADPVRHTICGIDTDADTLSQLSQALEAGGFTYDVQCGSMEEFRIGRAKFDVSFINPPFSRIIDSPFAKPYTTGAFGKYGKSSSHKSHVYALHQALEESQVVIALLPTSMYGFMEIEKHIGDMTSRLKIVYRLPANSFKEENANVDVSIFVFGEIGRGSRLSAELIPLKCLEWSPWLRVGLDIKQSNFRDMPSLVKHSQGTDKVKITRPVTFDNSVRVVHSGRHIKLKFNCGLTEALVLNRVYGSKVSHRENPSRDGRIPKGVVYTGQGRLDFENYLILKDPMKEFHWFLACLRNYGAETVVDHDPKNPKYNPGIINYLKRRIRRQKILAQPLGHTIYTQDKGLRHWLATQETVIGTCKVAHQMESTGGRYILHIPPKTKLEFRRNFISGHKGYVYEYKNMVAYISLDELSEFYRFDSFTPDDSGWIEIHKPLKEHFKHDHKQIEKLAGEKFLETWLSWGFQFDDLCEVKMRKGNTIVAWEMGLGKARLSLALCMLGGKHNLVVAESRLIREMLDEIRKLGIPQEDFQVIKKLEQAQNPRKINIASYSKLRTAKRTAKGKVKFPIAEALRGRIHTNVVDEIHNIKNCNALQTAALHRVWGKERYGMTGTPIDNYSRDILPLMQFVAGDGKANQPYGARHPFIQESNLQNMEHSIRGIDMFKNRFITFEWVTNEFLEDLQSGAKREIPKIKDLDAFRQMIAPIIKRRVMREPGVAKYINIPKSVQIVRTLKWDIPHLQFYARVSAEFSSWFMEYMKSQGHSATNSNLIALLARVSAVIEACNYPQGGVQGFGNYFEQTSKQRYIIHRLQQLVKENHKIMVFAQSPNVLNMFARQLETLNIQSVLFHGQILMDKRISALDEEFRYGPKPVLLASKGCMQAGYNLPMVDRILMYDRAWNAKTEMQAIARALRPQQLNVVQIELCHLQGSMDTYQAQMCQFKETTMVSGLDYCEDDLVASDFKHMETILYQFVKELEEKTGIKFKDLEKMRKSA